jgi:hypothetical protein
MTHRPGQTIVQRIYQCRLCNGGRRTEMAPVVITKPTMLCAYVRGMICNMQTYRNDPAVLRDTYRIKQH